MSQLLNPDRPMRADARRNRASILAAARELFATERPDVGIDEVAARAGVGVGTVYRHFPDKEALMGTLVRERFELFNDQLRSAIDDEAGEPFDALGDALRANMTSLAEDAATRFAFQNGGERVFAHADVELEEYLELCRVLVARAQAGGTLRADFVAEEIPMLMCGVSSTIAHDKPGWDWRRYMELVLRGMHAQS
jgi:AcrR family transcriptional regulator